MTTEAKRIALINECKKHYPTCDSNGRCPLFEKTSGRSCTAFDADVEINYDILVGEKKPDETADAVNHPAHYQGKHECIDEMIALFGVEAVKHFCMCNVYKYRYRAANKNGQEDLDKADWYMDKLMELGEQHD